ncbi:MAG: CCA tRNA nucleotidyltransferase [Rhodospirillales bacterium]|nr:CCA tRNA nucleotidyltransferase [Rhodospirillales bacterium]
MIADHRSPLADGAADTTAAASQPIGQLPIQGWLTAPETQRVLAALAAGGTEVRFIGGCVRDALLRRPVRDVDLALALPPEQVMARLAAAGLRAIPTGIDHGTVTAVIGRQHFEITSLRIDVETDGRRARVAFTDDWAADAARRDFTINAMSATADGAVYDYFGGIDDLFRGRIRFVGDARARIVEDALRLLRFFRFYGDYGRPPVDAAALAACVERADDVKSLSGERVRGELLRILKGGDVVDVIDLMAAGGVLAAVLPEAGTSARLARLVWLETTATGLSSVAPDETRRLAALIDGDRGGDGAAAASAIADRLKFSNHERLRLSRAIAGGWRIDPDEPAAALARALHRLGPESVRDRALLAWAGELAVEPRLPRARTGGWLRLLTAIDQWRPVEFPLKGRDALALGMPRGPAIGAALASVEDWWEAGGYTAGRDACLARLRAEWAGGAGPAGHDQMLATNAREGR